MQSAVLKYHNAIKLKIHNCISFTLKDGSCTGKIILDFSGGKSGDQKAWTDVLQPRNNQYISGVAINFNLTPHQGQIKARDLKILLHEPGHAFQVVLCCPESDSKTDLSDVEPEGVEISAKMFEGLMMQPYFLEKVVPPALSTDDRHFLESQRTLEPLRLLRKVKYALIDWHIHNNPEHSQMEEIAEKFGHYPLCFRDSLHIPLFSSTFKPHCRGNYYFYVIAELVSRVIYSKTSGLIAPEDRRHFTGVVFCPGHQKTIISKVSSFLGKSLTFQDGANRMTKYPLFLVGYYIVGGCALLTWEWIFLFQHALSSAQSSEGWLAASLFAVPVMVRLFFSGYLSNIASKMNDSKRWKRSLIVRLSTIPATIGLVVIEGSSAGKILLFSIFSLLSLFDCYLHYPFRFFCDAKKLLTQQRFQALDSLKKRMAVCIASSLAILSLNRDYSSKAVLSVSLILISLCTPLAAKLLYSRQISTKNQAVSDLTKSHKNLIQVNHFVMLMVLLNLFFGACGLFIASSVIENDLIIFEYISIQTIFYTGYMFHCLTLLFISARTKSAVHGPSFWTAVHLLSLSLILISLGKNSLVLGFTAALAGGLFYSFATNNFQCQMYYATRASDREKSFAKIEASGRYGLLMSQAGAGFWIDSGLDPMQGLVFSSGLASVSIGLY